MPTPKSDSISLVVTVGVQCHVGKERTENQDRVTRAATPFGDLFVVADGVGGYQGGSEAAQATVDGFVSYLNAHGNLPLSDALQQAVRSVSADLQQRSTANKALHGMGSTVVLCLVNGARATYAHAGDSRAYLLRDRRLKQLTRDHSLMERMVSEGILTPAQAREHPDASVLTRAIGQAPDVSLDIAEIALQPNDGLLLCSDGLWAYAQHGEMEALAASETLSASGVADALLNLALEGGGGDNISIQFLRFQALEPQQQTSSIFGMSSKMAIPTVGLASLLGMSTIGMFLWTSWVNREANKQPVAVSAPATPASAPDTADPMGHQGPRTPEPKPSAPAPPAPQRPPKTTATPAVQPSKLPAAGTGEANPKTAVVIIEGANKSAAEWAVRLEQLKDVTATRNHGTADCLDLAQSKAALFHSPQMAAAARRIGKELSLSSTAILEKKQDDLDQCDGEIIAMPPRSSIADRFHSAVKDTVQSVQKDTQPGVDAVKKKANKKIEGIKDKVVKPKDNQSD